jgi:hypothetical protein
MQFPLKIRDRCYQKDARRSPSQKSVNVPISYRWKLSANTQATLMSMTTYPSECGGSRWESYMLSCSIQISVLWTVIPCGLVDGYRHFGLERCCPHLQFKHQFIICITKFQKTETWWNYYCCYYIWYIWCGRNFQDVSYCIIIISGVEKINSRRATNTGKEEMPLLNFRRSSITTSDAAINSRALNHSNLTFPSGVM